MDGTLLSDDKKVSQENLAAIRLFVKAGGRFSVATGRSEVIAAPFLSDIPLNLPAIVYNGAAVYDFRMNRFLYQAELPRKTVRTFVNAALSVYPEVCAEVYTNGVIQLFKPQRRDGSLHTERKSALRISNAGGLRTLHEAFVLWRKCKAS